MIPAPSTASLRLLTYQQAAITSGTPEAVSAIKWGGSTASSGHTQCRGGQSNNAASRIALGGQSSDTAWPVGVNAIPMCTPR
jgi:hypothetical protein